jgi:hypothetical protein
MNPNMINQIFFEGRIGLSDLESHDVHEETAETMLVQD